MKSQEEIVKSNTESLGQIYGLLDRIAQSEKTWNKERAGYLYILRNQLADILSENYTQLVEDSKEMTEHTMNFGLGNERNSSKK